MSARRSRPATRISRKRCAASRRSSRPSARDMRTNAAGLGLAVVLGIAAAACGVGGPTSLQTGDCVNYQTITDGEGGQSIQKVATPCAQPHDGDVFLVFTMPGATFPGYFAIGDAQQDECSG